MNINNELVPLLGNINFSDRFNKISENYNDFENRLIDDNFESIQNIILSFGYKFKIDKSGGFFKLIEKISVFKIQFNIIAQRGIVEFIWGVEKGNERLKMGGSICGAIEFLTEQDFTAKPMYCTYDELKSILGEALGIYEDFKTELLKYAKTI